MPGSFGRVAGDHLRTYGSYGHEELLDVELFDPLEMTPKPYAKIELRVWAREECDEVSEEEYDELCRDWVLTHPNS